MNFESSYQKFRPTKFEEVVGQDIIIKTLNNAILKDHIGHAYLFYGPRGTGKTSIAKIFARRINCQCDKSDCILCNYTDKSYISDIIELDAASNNGVEEIRRIIDEVHYAPMEYKYKVYIIDEVHMLSKSAFNAILKTLEEPPSHVKFILATTEINKIPATIISRCQRFDFNRLSETQISNHLASVLKQQNIEYEVDALGKIAIIADGAMRDALSILDKVLMYNNSISVLAVSASLNIGEQEIYSKMLKAILNNNLNEILLLLDEIYQKSINAMNWTIDFQRHVRSILKTCLEQGDGNEKIYLIILKELSMLQERLLYTKNPRILLEVYLCDIDVSQNDTNFKKVKRQKPIIESQVVVSKNSQIVEQLSNQSNDDSMATQTVSIEQVVEENQEPEVTYQKVITPQAVDSDLIIHDILKDATHDAKRQYLNSCTNIISKLKGENLNGLAMFFETAELVAASNLGYVFTIKNDYVDSFRLRKLDIVSSIKDITGSNMVIFILSQEQWQEKREQFLKELKELQTKKDIYLEAQKIFGSEIVFKKQI